MTIVDDCSRFTWLCLIQNKTDVHIVLKDFLLLINTQFDVKVQVIKTDNETECISLFTFLGIIHQSSCPYTLQQNGTVERKHKHILNTARELRFQSGMSIKFWGNCIKTEAYLINRIPIAVLQGKSPYEMLHEKEPNIKHMTVFGCLCFASVLQKLDKFAPRAKRSMFMGYSETQKVYRIMDLETRRFYVSGDVTFMEHIFPFKEATVYSLDVSPQSYDCTMQLDIFTPHNYKLNDYQVGTINPTQEQLTDITLGTMDHANTHEAPMQPQDDYATPLTVDPEVVTLELLSENITHIGVPILSRRTDRVTKSPLWHKDYSPKQNQYDLLISYC